MKNLCLPLLFLGAMFVLVTLFLFEELTSDQLARLSSAGTVRATWPRNGR